MPGLYDTFQWAPGEALQSIANYGSQEAQQTDTLAQAAQRQAETQAYTSQAAQQMRQAEYQANTEKARQESILTGTGNNFFTENPEFTKKYVQSGYAAKMEENLNSMNDAKFNLLQNTLGNSWDPKTNTVDKSSYRDNWNTLNSIDPETAKQYANPDELDDDQTYKGVTAQVAHIQQNAKQRFQYGMQGAKLENRLNLMDVKMEALKDIAANNNNTKVIISGDTNATRRYGYDKRWDYTNAIHDKSNLSGNIPKVGDYGSIRDNVPMLTKTVSDFAQQNGLNIDDNNVQGIVSAVYPMAQSIYVKQAAQAQADKAANKPYSLPKSVPQIAQELAEQAITNPKQAETIKTWWGGNKTNINANGDYQEPSAQEPVGGTEKPPVPDSIKAIWKDLTPDQKKRIASTHNTSGLD